MSLLRSVSRSAQVIPSRFNRALSTHPIAIAALLAAPLLLFVASSCNPRPKPRLFVIGLDGATWDLLDPWIEAGDLPNLKALREASSWGTMNSVLPCLSPPAWTSAVTGVNPGRHGIFDFQRRSTHVKAVISETANSRAVDPIWLMLKDTGLRCGVVNVPMTDPPDDIHGIMVAGLPHPDQNGWAKPPEVEERLRKMGYLLDEMEMRLPEGEEDAIFDRYLRGLRARAEAVRSLYSEADYDFFWVVFTEPDRVQHCFWQFDDPESPKYNRERAARWGGSMRKLWIEQDRVLGELLAMLRPDTWVLVLSDHGFGPLHREMRVGNYLRRADTPLSPGEADQVFSLEPTDAGRLYVRDPAKDPGGHLLPEARADLERRVAADLEAAIDPKSNEHPVAKAYARDSIFVGPLREKAPALTLHPTGAWCFTVGDREEGYHDEPFGECSSTLSGWHRMNGVFVLKGPKAAPGRVAEPYSLLDVVPTCLYVLRQAMPQDLDGGIMDDCFDPEYRSRVRPVVRGFVKGKQDTLTAEEEARIGNIPYISQGRRANSSITP